MLSKCANPACSAAFRFLHEGRIFTVVSGPAASLEAGWDHTQARPQERYWLCQQCAQRLTITVVDGHAVVRRLPVAAARYQSGVHAA